jgi:hypothetical protein
MVLGSAREEGRSKDSSDRCGASRQGKEFVMPPEISNDAVAIAASNLVLATIQAQAASGGLDGLSSSGAPREVESLFADMVNVVQRTLPAPPGK